MFMPMISSQSKDYLHGSKEKNLYARHIVIYDLAFNRKIVY